MPRIKLRSPEPSSGITFGRLGYADAAKASYEMFSHLKQGGGIPFQCRFQVSLPTPYAITGPVVPEDKAVVEAAYEVAMFAELDEITATLPQDELAIQWDVAIEIITLEGMLPAHVSSNIKADILERLIRLGNLVPAKVELGYHLCYGDAGHKHFVEPRDTSLLVEVANALSTGVRRELQWIHLSGLSLPTSGEIRVMGYDVRRQAQAVRRILGAVPQETALYEELTAWVNMDFHADLFGIPRKEKRERITAMLQLVQLLDRKDSQVRTFSGGMKRRLALGRALLHDPQLIYLDEPTLGVDIQARRVIWDYILALRDQGKTVLITTNYLEEAQALCERIAIIDHGKLVALDTPEHLKQSYGGSVVEVETAQPMASVVAMHALPGVKEVKQDGTHLTITTEGVSRVVPQIINLISQESELRDISVREPTLDEIFLRLTGTALRD